MKHLKYIKIGLKSAAGNIVYVATYTLTAFTLIALNVIELYTKSITFFFDINLALGLIYFLLTMITTFATLLALNGYILNRLWKWQ